MRSVIVGGGDTLTARQVESWRGCARVVVINNAFRLAPWADHLHAADISWWRANPDALEFRGSRSTVRPQPSYPHIDLALAALRREGIAALQATGDRGYDATPGCVRTGGGNGGYQMIHRELQGGAQEIILLGFTMRPGHWHAPHPLGQALEADYALWRERLLELAGIAATMGARVVNETPGSALPLR